MGVRISPGFTVIETVLFLSVTGLLVLGVLIGTGNAVNAQRYRDATESFKDLLQTQYAELASVKNSRSNTWTCDATALPNSGGSEIRGQSDCILIGKYMTIKGGDISIYTVLARPRAALGGSDINKLDNNYNFNIVTSETDTRSMEWGTQLAWPSSGIGSQFPTSPRDIGILFVRSPDSGNIYTFTDNNAPDISFITQATFTNMIVAGQVVPGQGERTLCVLSSGLAPSSDTSIYLSPYAASASAIEVRSNDYMQSIGVSTRC